MIIENMVSSNIVNISPNYYLNDMLNNKLTSVNYLITLFGLLGSLKLMLDIFFDRKLKT